MHFTPANFFSYKYHSLVVLGPHRMSIGSRKGKSKGEANHFGLSTIDVEANKSP